MTAPVAPPQFRPEPGHQPDPSRPDRGPLIQRVLLGAGALCVLVAGAVYLAVAWHRIGSAGQSGFALVVTAAAALGAHLLNRRGLRTSAEAFAVVASGLLALDLAGAHHLDVLGAAGLEWWSWLTIATGAVLVVAAVLALVDRLAVYRVVATASLAVVPFTGLAALDRGGLDLSAGTLTVVGLVVAGGLLALAVAAGRRDGLVGTVAASGAAAWWLLAAAAGTVAAGSAARLSDVVPATLAWALLGAGALVAAGRAIAAGRSGDAGIVVSVAAPLAAAPAAWIVAAGVTSFGAAAALAVAAIIALLWAVPWTSTAGGLPVGLGAAVTSALLVPSAAYEGFGFDLTGALVLVVGAAALGGTWHGRGALRAVAGTGAVVAAVVGTGLLAVERTAPGLWLTTSWTVIATALVLAATFVGAARDALLAAGTMVGTAGFAAGGATQLLDVSRPGPAIALLGLGAAVLTHGAVRSSRTAVLLGSGALAVAAMDLALAERVVVTEAYTLPVAAVVLVAGLLGRTRRPELSSWAWSAPAVLVAAVPSVAVALADTGVTRLIVVAAVAGVVTAAGLRFRLAAPLLLGAATEAVLAVSQLAPYAVGAPRWVTLALAGVLLLTLGVLFERARRGAAAAGRWYAELN